MLRTRGGGNITKTYILTILCKLKMEFINAALDNTLNPLPPTHIHTRTLAQKKMEYRLTETLHMTAMSFANLDPPQSASFFQFTRMG